MTYYPVLQEYAADVPRFSGSARRLLIEGQRTNGIRNPRAEGGVPGTPGTMPTNWQAANAHGLEFSVVGTGTEQGRPYIDLRCAGTSTVFGSVSPRFDAANVIAAATGQTWTGSVFLSLVAGSLANLSGGVVNLRLEELNSASGTLVFTPLVPATGLSAVPTRYSITRTFAHADTAFTRFALHFSPPAADLVVDLTLRIAWPQLEQGAFASTTILPPVGTPAASTRGADLVSASLASLGIAGPCTILGTFMLPQTSATGSQNLIQVSDGGDNNRFMIRNTTASNELRLFAVNAGSGGDGVSAGNITPGAAFRVGVALNGAGRIAASLNGAAAVSRTGGITSGLTTLLIGSRHGADYMFGEVGSIIVLPHALSDAALAARVAALPL